jgi:hypothetical protein
MEWKQSHPKNGGCHTKDGAYQVSEERVWVARKFGTPVGIGKTVAKAKQAAEEHANNPRLSK